MKKKGAKSFFLREKKGEEEFYLDQKRGATSLFAYEKWSQYYFLQNIEASVIFSEIREKGLHHRLVASILFLGNLGK